MVPGTRYTYALHVRVTRALAFENQITVRIFVKRHLMGMPPHVLETPVFSARGKGPSVSMPFERLPFVKRYIYQVFLPGICCRTPTSYVRFTAFCCLKRSGWWVDALNSAWPEWTHLPFSYAGHNNRLVLSVRNT